MSLHGHHQVDLDEVQGHGGLGHGDLQQRLVACGPGAQVAELHIGTGELNFLMKDLRTRGTHTASNARGWWAARDPEAAHLRPPPRKHPAPCGVQEPLPEADRKKKTTPKLHPTPWSEGAEVMISGLIIILGHHCVSF